jgi:hypothetical protein
MTRAQWEAELGHKPNYVPWFAYRFVMRIAHRLNWHYAPPCYPDGDTLLWCHWCGFRAVVRRKDDHLHELKAALDRRAEPR